MVPENKQNRRYTQINFQNNRHPSQHTVGNVHKASLIWCPQVPDQGSTVGGLLSVSLPEEHHKRHMVCRCGSNPRTCDSGSAIES
jgi:hypothetical protein